MDKPLQIAFYSDAMMSSQRYGLGRYAWELFRELNKLGPETAVRPVAAHVELAPDQLLEMKRDHGFVPLPWPRKVTAACWSLLGQPLLERATPWADVVHAVELDYRIATKKPLVVTIHDIGPLTHPHFFSHSHPWLLRTALRSAARKAAAIICVSQTTADAVEGYLKQSLGDRLQVIPEGVSSDFLPGTHPDCFKRTDVFMRTGQPFFLWAGSLNPRKNLSGVIKAFEAVAQQIPHHLVITGGIGWDANPILERVRSSELRARIHLPGRVDDAELRGLYQKATAFLYPSFMEGFGLPILEGMASGCPVITSNLSSMPEVAGDAALQVDPHSADEIGEAMLRLAVDGALAAKYRESGLQHAKLYRWDKCAQAVAGIYHQVAGCQQACPASAVPYPLTNPVSAHL